jgi:endonuclease/exonuclease/phosphatase family metal-dependent hydrolase
MLQEVNSYPEWLENEFEIVQRRAVKKTGTLQTFSSIIGVRGTLLAEVPLRSSRRWLNDELDRFSGNVFCVEVRPERSQHPIKVVCVYSPAWPVQRARLAGVDLTGIRLELNKDLWVSDLLRFALLEMGLKDGPWIVAGDFNMCETFDQWRDGPRGNREYLDRMIALGLHDCLRQSRGKLTPTFRTVRTQQLTSQLDYVFVTQSLLDCLVDCSVGSISLIESGTSDHLPVVADFHLDQLQ